MSPSEPTPGKPSHPKNLLHSINSPEDLKKIPVEQLPQLAGEIRNEIINVTSRNGGHVGPNLGVVELTVAMHYVFDSPKDQFVFDVSHQSYAHKLLTGRGGEFFRKLRQSGGASGFFNREESEHDSFGAGHAGTALSAALGMAAARDLRGSNEHVLALCGDGAFTCGITQEALNNIGTCANRLIVILNDNQWSISKNVGAFARHLTRLTTHPTYNKLHSRIQKFITSRPGGKHLHHLWTKWKRETKDFFVESSLFEKLGLRYFGPIEGHDFPELIKHLEFAKQAEEPIILHVITQKGRGLEAAIEHPEKFHGAAPYDPFTGETIPPKNGTPTYTDIFGDSLLEIAKENPQVIGITAAMASGTGLSKLSKELPGQFFDVGIAEEHAALFAAGLATKGMHPVVAIYSTFLQRAHDQIIHDLALQKLPVTFCMDRAGLSPSDGPTHHGLFDISLIRCVPNVVLMQPKDEDELINMLHTSVRYKKGPSFIRYPRGCATGIPLSLVPQALPVGKAEIIQEGDSISIWALGNMNADAREVAQELLSSHDITPSIVNARFVKPLDTELLLKQAAKHKLIVTMEDGMLSGGFGSAVLETLQEANIRTPVLRIGWPDTFVPHGTDVAGLRKKHHLRPAQILKTITEHPVISKLVHKESAAK